MRPRLSLLLACLPMWACDSTASELELSGGITIELPNYAHRRTSFDGSTCVDVGKKDFFFVVCFSGRRLSESARDNGFKKYSDISSEDMGRVQPLPSEAYVFVTGGSYGWLYPTKHRRLGEFDVYEVDNVLCRDDSPGLGQPATCYTAALSSHVIRNLPLSIYVDTIIEKHLGPVNEISAMAKFHIESIREFIKKLKIHTGNVER
ncbi:hypothetical protein BAR24066_06820 [Burkholderia arboris]|uniref:Lipoprotein n=1 Tax=Burkholderia arboris TaxID=488730 RepID=A0A9Q9SQM0_9BURK|nr:hypothetical protein [Burkholderia arboris]VWC38882.1 hypothetical protein BAR24066_06820 [Burkholderia arboris]